MVAKSDEIEVVNFYFLHHHLEFCTSVCEPGLEELEVEFLPDPGEVIIYR